MDLLRNRPTLSCWDLSMAQFRDRLLEAADEDARRLLSHVLPGNAADRPVQEALQSLFRDLRLYLDVSVTEDGYVSIDIGYEAPQETGLVFRHRWAYTGPWFQMPAAIAQAPPEVTPAQTEPTGPPAPKSIVPRSCPPPGTVAFSAPVSAS